MFKNVAKFTLRPKKAQKKFLIVRASGPLCYHRNKSKFKNWFRRDSGVGAFTTDGIYGSVVPSYTLLPSSPPRSSYWFPPIAPSLISPTTRGRPNPDPNRHRDHHRHHHHRHHHHFITNGISNFVGGISFSFTTNTLGCN